MDIFSVLHQDHEAVANIFRKIETMKGKNASPETREQLFKELYMELSLHADVEEEIVYPVFEDNSETEDIVNESLQEHEEIESLLNELKDMRPDSSDWMAKIGELKQEVEHHVREEEQNLFPRARKIIGEGEAQELAETFQTAKDELRGQRSGHKTAT